MNMRFLWTAGMAAIVSLATTLPALAEMATLKGEPGTQINVRSQPSTTAASPHYGVVGDRVDILRRVRGQDNYPWYYVRFASGAEGWIRGDLVLPDGSGSSSQRVRFASGSYSATLQGQVQGYNTRDYVVNLAQGQTLAVDLNTDNSFVYFVIFKPDGDNLTNIETTNWSGPLAAGGDYKVRVFMVRAEARRGGMGNYTLKMSAY